MSKLPRKINESRFEQLIEELADDHCNCEYCFLKKFIQSLHPEPIVLVQLKCIEIFKWDQSKVVGYDIGWNEAGMRWSIQGYAQAFRKVFNENLTIHENYKRTIEEIKKTF